MTDTDVPTLGPSATELLQQERLVAIGSATLADQVVAALLPPRAVRASRSCVPLPVARLVVWARDGSFVSAMGRVDASGTVAATLVLDALGWRPGDRIDIRAMREVVTVRRDRRGLYAVPKRRVIVIPALARHGCGIRAGARLLLVAAPEHELLIVYTESALDRMLTLYHAAITSDESAA